jgi:hypothetical protein
VTASNRRPVGALRPTGADRELGALSPQRLDNLLDDAVFHRLKVVKKTSTDPVDA